MKSYSLELVKRRTGSGMFGKLAAAALIGAGVYYGYKKLTKEDKNKDVADAGSQSTYDAEAHEGDDFATRILKAAKRIIK